MISPPHPSPDLVLPGNGTARRLRCRVLQSPLAGVSDRIFRGLVRRWAPDALLFTEMVNATSLELGHGLIKVEELSSEPGPIGVQLFDHRPAAMADAARRAEAAGAFLIDINMGCPAKKVCNKWAGSALMQNETLAIEIAEAVVAACAPRGVPVTLKMRTGWCDTEKNALVLAKAFESVGIQMVTVHGRTREQGYKGFAEYDTVAAVKAALKIPVVANGDIDSPEKALEVLKLTGADALMVGRAAQGRPWIFREVVHFLATGEHLAPPLVAEVKRALLDHLQDHYGLYGELTGVRSARKHIGWYVRGLPGGDDFRDHMNTLETAESQSLAVADFFEAMASRMERMPKAVSGQTPEMVLETME